MADTNLLVLAREYKKLREEVKKVLSMPNGDKGDPGEKGEKGDKGDTGPQGFPGRDGKDGINGFNGKDGRDGIDGKDGKDGLDGVGVSNAYIDFDNSLVIVLSDGREVNAGFLSQETKENVVATFKQGAATINELLPPQEGNANKFLKTDGTDVFWADGDGTGTVTSVSGTGSVSGITLSGTVTNSGSLTLGGSLDLSSPPAIGNTTPNAATFTTLSTGALTATGSGAFGTSISASSRLLVKGGASGQCFRVEGSSGGFVNIDLWGDRTSGNLGGIRAYNGADANEFFAIVPQATKVNTFFNLGNGSSAPTTQFALSNTANAVNYVQVTGAPTTREPVLSVQGSDTNISMAFQSKGTGGISLSTGSTGTNLVNGTTVTAITRTAAGSGYTTAPDVIISPPTTAGGVQATATVAISGGAITTFTITNAGSGYVEQPTVTFSGGGGSGAAAYATVGSGTTVRSLGGTLDFYTPNANIGLRVYDSGGGGTAYWRFAAGFAATATQIASSAGGNIATGGAGSLNLQTNNVTTQMVVSHTASAVNYVQVTGASTTNGPIVSAQGSDANVNLFYQTKGTGGHVFYTNSGVSGRQFDILHTGNAVNRPTVTGSISGAAPVFGVAGSDTNIDLALTPKGTGNVRFGTHTTLGSEVITGYITIKDSGGTLRKLAVIS